LSVSNAFSNKEKLSSKDKSLTRVPSLYLQMYLVVSGSNIQLRDRYSTCQIFYHMQALALDDERVRGWHVSLFFGREEDPSVEQ